MKKCLMICFLILTVLMLSVTVHADVIYEPYDDFYFEHRAECTYVNRSFTAAGPNGTVTLYVDPLNPAVEKTYPNGTVFTVSYAYKSPEGVSWGCCDMWQDGITGWAPMEYLELSYEGISFEDEYADSFVPVEGSLDAATITNGAICFWLYPGSETVDTIEVWDDYLPEYYYIYTDADGVRWGQCGYYYGIRNYWINLDDPSGVPQVPMTTEREETTAETFPEPSVESTEEIKPAGNNLKTGLIVAVAAVVIVTAVLLILLKKKRA